MTYQIVYGLETESLEDPTQIVLLDLPDNFSDVDTEDLESTLHYDHELRSRGIGEAPTPFTYQELVGLQDVIETLRVILAKGNVPQATATALLQDLYANLKGRP